VNDKDQLATLADVRRRDEAVKEEVFQTLGSRIVMHSLNNLGNPLVVWDPTWSVYVELGPIPVVDSNGDIVTM
jgi:hypothetical protein